jgi:hypothetical protein
VSIGKITDSLALIASSSTASEYKAEETPSTARNSDAVIILGISYLSMYYWGADREKPTPHD